MSGFFASVKSMCCGSRAAASQQVHAAPPIASIPDHPEEQVALGAYRCAFFDPPLSSFLIRRNALQRKPSPRSRYSDGSAVRAFCCMGALSYCNNVCFFCMFYNQRFSPPVSFQQQVIARSPRRRTEFFSIFVSSAKAVRTVYALFESLIRDSAAQRQPRAALILGVIYFKWV